MCNLLCISHISLTCVHIWFTIKTCFHWWLFWSNHNVETGEFRNNIDYHIERSYREYTHHGLGLWEAASLLRQFWSECYCVGHRRSAGNSIRTSRTSVSFIVQLFLSLLCKKLQMNCLEVAVWHMNTHNIAVVIYMPSEIISNTTLDCSRVFWCHSILYRGQNF